MAWTNPYGNHANKAAASTLPSTHHVKPVPHDLPHVPPSQAEWERAIYARLNIKLTELAKAQDIAHPESASCDILFGEVNDV